MSLSDNTIPHSPPHCLALRRVCKHKCTVVHTIMGNHAHIDITFMTEDGRELGYEPVSGEASFLTVG